MEQATELIVPKTEDLKQYFNEFAAAYEKNLEKSLMQTGLSLVELLELSEAETILDAGCGSGFLGVEILRRKPKAAKLIMTELSDQMLAKALNKMNFINSHPQKLITLDDLMNASSAEVKAEQNLGCLLYTSPSPRDRQKSRMPSSA
eukprot:TRINITY_DN10387_c0_g1_i1.p1 TRINITY_DN10387_c0_g1~~TRINITY_DN10387_c0_g1_i1.p1  ORF type:complete len:147 (+),score=32.05 TRINITY_DN10387_c0_g1_i1:117-557(+)